MEGIVTLSEFLESKKRIEPEERSDVKENTEEIKEEETENELTTITVRDSSTKTEYEVILDSKEWEYYMDTIERLRNRIYSIKVDEGKRIISIIDKNGNRLGIISAKEIRRLTNI